jgi:integration host factor subunit beta
MIRSELIARIAERKPHLYAKEVEDVVATILDTMSAALTRGDRVELRGFGSFTTQETEARTGRNPKSGQTVEVPARTKVEFRASKVMRARLNHQRAEPDKKRSGCSALPSSAAGRS